MSSINDWIELSHGRIKLRTEKKKRCHSNQVQEEYIGFSLNLFINWCLFAGVFYYHNHWNSQWKFSLTTSPANKTHSWHRHSVRVSINYSRANQNKYDEYNHHAYLLLPLFFFFICHSFIFNFNYHKTGVIKTERTKDLHSFGKMNALIVWNAKNWLTRMNCFMLEKRRVAEKSHSDTFLHHQRWTEKKKKREQHGKNQLMSLRYVNEMKKKKKESVSFCRVVSLFALY